MKPTKKTRKNRMKGGNPSPSIVPNDNPNDNTKANQNDFRHELIKQFLSNTVAAPGPGKRRGSRKDPGNELSERRAAAQNHQPYNGSQQRKLLKSNDYLGREMEAAQKQKRQRQKQQKTVPENRPASAAESASAASRSAAQEDQPDNICNDTCIEKIAESVVEKLKQSNHVNVVVTPPDEQSELEKMQSLVDDPTSFKRDHEYSELFMNYLKAYMLENYGRFNSIDIEQIILDLNSQPSPQEPQVIYARLHEEDARFPWHKFFKVYSSGDNQQIKEYFDMVDRYEDLSLEVYSPPYLSKAALQERIDTQTEKNKKIDKIMRMVNNLQYFEIHYIITKEDLNKYNPELLDTFELILQTMTKIELIFSSNTYVSSTVVVSKDGNIEIVLLIKLYLYCVFFFLSEDIHNAVVVSELLLSYKTYLNRPRFSPVATGLPLVITDMSQQYNITYDAIFANSNTPPEIINALQLEMNKFILPMATKAWEAALAPAELAAMEDGVAPAAAPGPVAQVSSAMEEGADPAEAPGPVAQVSSAMEEGEQ